MDMALSAQTEATQKNYTTDATQVSGLWSGFRRKDYVLWDWASVGLPAAVNYDAKYVYSRTFNYLLSNDGTWAAK